MANKLYFFFLIIFLLKINAQNNSFNVINPFISKHFKILGEYVPQGDFKKMNSNFRSTGIFSYYHIPHQSGYNYYSRIAEQFSN